MADRYTLYAVQYDESLIDQITAQAVNPGIQLALSDADGAVDPTYAAVMSQQPTFAWTSTALKTALDAVGIDGAILGATEALELYLQLLSADGTRKTGESHTKVSSTTGLIVPTSIQAAHNGIANVSMQAWLRSSDGVTAPFAETASQSLPAGGGSVDALWTAGKVAINGSELEDVQNIAVTMGISVVPFGGSGHVFPTALHIIRRTPSILITTTDAAVLDTFGVSGTAQGDTDSEVYFRKLTIDSATRVADETAEHIKIAIDAGIITVESVPANHPNAGTPVVRITPRYDGTNAIIAISTASAIT